MSSIIAMPFTFVLGLIFLKPSDYIFYIKWLISFICLKISRRFVKKRFDLYDYSVKNDPIKVNFINPPEEYELDSLQSDLHLQNKNDEMFFYGMNSKSETLIVKINRRLNYRADACIYLKLASGKTYQLDKTSDFEQSSTDEMTFSCGALRLKCLSPMRRWRIFYAGYLREISEDSPDSGKMVYVKFALLWAASSDIYDFKTDINDKHFARGIAKATWRNWFPPIKKFETAFDFYGQAGVIHGTVTINDEFQDLEVYLFGQRIRYLGDTSYMAYNEFSHILGYTKKTGAYFHIGSITSDRNERSFSFGFVVQPDTDLKGIKTASVSTKRSDSDGKLIIKAEFETDTFSYKADGFLFDIASVEPYNLMKKFYFSLNGETGYGVSLKRINTKVEETVVPEIKVLMPSVVPVVMSFSEKLCQLPQITGGKGSSLGKLTHLSKELKEFSVPYGIVVTTSAYESFLTKSILKRIIELEEILYKSKANMTEVSEVCLNLTQEFINTEFSSKLRYQIIEKMDHHFGEKIVTQKFAVRSSATGEDTDQLSAAGQMETFLGVEGIEEILIAIKKCWASQFNTIAVNYKRNYGQKINSPMAVVVQEMIPSDVAGVLFTCDPLTGNPTLMSITANYGLGESVVSGSEEPDTITLKKDEYNQIQLLSIDVGAKSKKIIAGEQSGTQTTEVPENDRNSCSLSEEMILQLGSIAVKIEKRYRSHRDIEWGFYKGSLYIFQSRPVTSSFKETDYEIDHEFDSPMRVENDFHSVSNVGEVMPNAISPLSLDVTFKGWRVVMNSKDKVTIFQLKGQTQYFAKGWVIMYSHFIFNVADVFPLKKDEEISLLKKATIISFFGRLPENEEMYQVSRDRYGTSIDPNPFLNTYILIKTTLMTSKFLQRSKKIMENYRIPIEKYKSSKELFKALLQGCTDISYVSLCHTVCTQTSALLNMIVFSALGTANEGFDDTVYKDFAKLIKTDSGTESVDVPCATQNLAYYIAQEKKPEEFRKMTTEEALNWLQNSQSVAGQKFRKFLENHGHRCLQEFDVYSHPWRENPEMIIKLLQTLVGSAVKEATEKKQDDYDIFSEITVPLGFITKFFLKLILPFTRKAVQYREMSKSLIVKGTDEWRKGWRKLAQLMVQEGRLPEEDLLFFIPIDSIQHLLKTNSPNIIAKAMQRKKRFPILNEYKFPEIMKGFPRPINNSETEEIHNDVNFSMKGLPVSQGVVKGFVRKAVTLEEADHIKPGEILVTYSTDIGWSPYFPHLAGVVTELGGLISHGAVVSREYGIPCIAGLHGVTKQFQTGDYVILDGNKGILQKLELPTNLLNHN